METSNNQRLDEQQRQLDFEGTQLDWRQRQLDFEQLFHQGQQSVWEFRKRQQQIEFERLLLQGQQIVLDFRKGLRQMRKRNKERWDESVKRMQESGSQIVPTSQDNAPPAIKKGRLSTPAVTDLDEVQSCQEKDGALFVTTEHIASMEDSSNPTDEKHIEVPIANANREIQIQIGSVIDDVKKPPYPEILEPSKVNSDPSETPPVDYTAEKIGELVVLLIEWMEIRLGSAKKISCIGLTKNSIDNNLGNLGARQMFAKRIETKFVLSRMCVRQSSLDRNFTLDDECYCLDLASGVVLVYDPGGTILSMAIHQGITEFAGAGRSLVVLSDGFVRRYRDSFGEQRNHVGSLPFDRGKISSDVLKAQMEFWKVVFAQKDVVLVFDPGIIECLGQLGKSSIGSGKALYRLLGCLITNWFCSGGLNWCSNCTSSAF